MCTVTSLATGRCLRLSPSVCVVSPTEPLCARGAGGWTEIRHTDRSGISAAFKCCRETLGKIHHNQRKTRQPKDNLLFSDLHKPK